MNLDDFGVHFLGLILISGRDRCKFWFVCAVWTELCQSLMKSTPKEEYRHQPLIVIAQVTISHSHYEPHLQRPLQQLFQCLLPFRYLRLSLSQNSLLAHLLERTLRHMCLLRTHHLHGSTLERLVNTYSTIVRHSSYFKVLWVASLALPSCPQKMLRLGSSLPAF